jgi:hypothetical protein
MRAGSLESSQRGYLLVVLMFALALFGVGLATVGRWESEMAQRDREKELLRTGAQVVEAIRAYYLASPGSINLLPSTWDDLLEDHRYIGTLRHLRRIPVDPFSHRDDWTILRNPQGQMIGLASSSTLAPLARVAVRAGHLRLTPVGRYCDWQFVFDPSTENLAPVNGAQKTARTG